MKKFILYSLFLVLCTGGAFAADMSSRGADAKSAATSARSSIRAAAPRATAPVRAEPDDTADAPAARTSVARRAVAGTRGVLANTTSRGAAARTNAAEEAAARGTAARASVIVRRNATAAPVPTAESIAAATEKLENTATLNSSCQAQYNDCMDQFCSVIDANQKRCSCSANLSRYTRVETAVKEANTQLNDVAQRIRYVGLSADEIRAIMSATEAELVLDQTVDATESRDMLSQIEDLIKNPAAETNSSGNMSLLDLDLDFSSDPADIFSLDFLGNNAATFSNMRGTELYSAAKKRCAAVLSACSDAGGNQTQITGNYDLAIDRDCIAYEAGLTKMNETLLNNVRSANLMLQKARLAVLNNKNQYDAKGCVAALDACMMDEMVCGPDYDKCLDPTKRFIDENGKVVLGQDISKIIDFMQNYNNAEINQSFIENSRNAPYSVDNCAGMANAGQCIVRYLVDKIGTGDKPTDGGLCRAVLDKCQRYTYDERGRYVRFNDVVVNYIQRAMVNVMSGQRKLISDYASSCMVDVANCYNQQVSQVNAWSSNASADSVYNVMRGACRNVALTCAYGVFAYDTTGQCTDEATCLDNVSEMFYQSLLCPDNSTYQPDTVGVPGTNSFVNTKCKCDTNFVVWGNTCMRKCVNGTYRNESTGYCTQCPSTTPNSVPDATGDIVGKAKCTA